MEWNKQKNDPVDDLNDRPQGYFQESEDSHKGPTTKIHLDYPPSNVARSTILEPSVPHLQPIRDPSREQDLGLHPQAQAQAQGKIQTQAQIPTPSTIHYGHVPPPIAQFPAPQFQTPGPHPAMQTPYPLLTTPSSNNIMSGSIPGSIPPQYPTSHRPPPPSSHPPPESSVFPDHNYHQPIPPPPHSLPNLGSSEALNKKTSNNNHAVTSDNNSTRSLSSGSSTHQPDSPSVSPSTKASKTASAQAKNNAKRSRMGCITCRQRKKRCCETRPKCTECRRLRLNCVWPAPGTEHKNKSKELKEEENVIYHEIYGKIKVLRGIVEYKSDEDPNFQPDDDSKPV